MSGTWFEIEDKEVRQALRQLLNKVEDPSGELMQIGELMVDRTRQRFGTGTAPDGTPWPENSQVTLQRYLANFDSAFNKETGALTKLGSTRLGGKKPLIGETGQLSQQIAFRLIPGGLEWGSIQNVKYARMQQYGGKKSQFPNLWGDIPARPFLGISPEDTDDVLQILYRGIEKAWDGS